MKVGDKIKIVKVNEVTRGIGFYHVGDVAKLIQQDDDGDWWADFSGNDEVLDDGIWCVGKGSRFEILES